MVENHEEYYFDTEELEDIIIYYLELGDISYAEMAVNYGLKLHPNSLEIKTKQLEVLLELEDYNVAKKLIGELAESCTESTDYLVCCAKYYSNLGNPRRAIEYCEKALKQEEEQNFLHNFIADEFVNLEDPFKALKHYKMALSIDPADEYAFENCVFCFSELKKYDEAIEFMNRYLDRFPYSETAWYEYGQFHFNRKNYEEAIKAFDYLLAINSRAVNVYGLKAGCLEALGRHREAILVYQEVLEIEFTKAHTYYRIGLCYRTLKMPVLALSAFQKSLIEDPQFYQAMMEQSYLYEELGAMKEALHFAREATALNGNNLDYQKRMAYLYIDAGKYEESLECLKKLVQNEPGRFYNWYAYVEVLMLVGEHEEAVTVLNDAVKVHHRAELFYQRSNCWMQLKNAAHAQNDLKTALELDESIVQEMILKYPGMKDELRKVKSGKK